MGSFVDYFRRFFCYVFWFKPAKIQLLGNLEKISDVMRQHPGDWESIKSEIRQVVKPDAKIWDVWVETEHRVIQLPVAEKREYFMFGVPKDLWNSHALLSRSFNFGLAEAVPNILVGVGLFFTFLFLSLALAHTTAALTDASSSKETEEAISQLLRVAGGKFWTSLAGLMASIAWTYFFRQSLNEVSVACDKFLADFSEVVSPSGGERITFQQLESADGALQHARDNNALTEELLNEAREQTGTFKRFETDLAISLAGAITQAFTPQMQSMTERLVSSIDGLSEKLGTMNQEALKTMMDDFAAMLKQATATEMEQLQRTLEDLARNLKGAGESFGAGANSAADAIHAAGSHLVERVQETTSNLIEGAGSLERATSTVSFSLQELSSTVDKASSVGRQGIEIVHQALAQAGQTSQALAETSDALAETTVKFTGVGQAISSMVENVQETSREQRELVLSVREAAPSALMAVERVTDLLTQAAAHTLATMEQAKCNIESASTVLGKTVTSISELGGSIQAIQKNLKVFETTVESVTSAGQRGADFVNQTLEKANESFQQLAFVSSSLVEASQGLSSASGIISNVVDNVDELAREQRAVVLSVKEVAPSAMAAVERVTKVLDQAAAQTLSSMQHTRSAMESTANALGKTVGSITEGVSIYSSQIADLHRSMDSQLARAVGSFDKGVAELTEVLEDFNENLQSARGS